MQEKATKSNNEITECETNVNEASGTLREGTSDTHGAREI